MDLVSWATNKDKEDKKKGMRWWCEKTLLLERMVQTLKREI
jgi:hypothetical protein